MTHDAVIGSLLRYALTFTGSCFPPYLMKRINTQIVNIAARRIGDLSRSTRIESLHYTVGTTTIYNLYVRHCAEFLDASMRANNSTINDRLREMLGTYYGVTTFSTRDVQVEIPLTNIQATLQERPLPRHWSTTCWFCRVFEEKPGLQAGMEIPSMYVSNADEINRVELRRMQMYTFENTHYWVDVAVQVLHYIGWSPECSNPHQLNISKIVPPAYTKTRFHLRSGGDVNWELREDEKWRTRRPIRTLNIQVGASVIDRIGATVCLITNNNSTLYSGLYIHGRFITEDPPAYLSEAAILHGIRALHGWINSPQGSETNYDNFNM